MDSWVYYALGVAFLLLVYIYLVIRQSDKKVEPPMPEMYSQYFSPEDLPQKEGFYTRSYQRPVFLFIGGVIMIVMFGILNPGLADYVTMARMSPFWASVILYMLFGGSISFFLSTLFNESILSKKVVVSTAMMLMIFLLIDLWFPVQIIKMDGDIVLERGYTLSFDYVLFSFYRSLFGLDYLMLSFFGVLFGWVLVYLVTTPFLLLGIMVMREIRIASR